MTATKNRSNNLALLRRIFQLVSPYRLRLSVVLFVSVLMAFLSLVTPYLIQYALDHAILQSDYRLLQNLTLLLIVVLLCNVLLSFFFTYQSGWLGQTIIKNLRVQVFQHLLNNNIAFFDVTPIGTATTRTINDIESINEIFSEGILNIISDILTILAIIVFMFITSWKLTLVTLSVLPVLLIAAYLFKEGVRKTFQEVRNQVTRMNTFLQEHISGMLIVQLFGAEPREMLKFNEINESHKQAHIKSIFYYSVFFPVVEIISSLALGAMLWYWAGAYMEGMLTLGQLNAFIICINMLFRPIRMLADKFNTLQMGLIAAERVFKITDDHSHQLKDGNIPFTELKHSLEFRNVSYEYIKGQPVLKHVSFTIYKGETVAIVGATGSGKSTVISLLNRLYDINEGEILLDGMNIKQFQIDTLRAGMALVQQDVFLFSGTILENITLYQDIPVEQVYAAARFCGADEFISQLPGGYQYQVMERGHSLSTGQRQLISIVRAIIQNPQILILDEATASIDASTERILQHAIETALENRTSIIIAHRLSTIKKATKIIVMQEGVIAEMGTHNELMASNGLYAQLYQSQWVS